MKTLKALVIVAVLFSATVAEAGWLGRISFAPQPLRFNNAPAILMDGFRNRVLRPGPFVVWRGDWVARREIRGRGR